MSDTTAPWEDLSSTTVSERFSPAAMRVSASVGPARTTCSHMHSENYKFSGSRERGDSLTSPRCLATSSRLLKRFNLTDRAIADRVFSKKKVRNWSCFVACSPLARVCEERVKGQRSQ